MQASLIAPGGYKSKIREKVAMHMISGDYKLGADEKSMSKEELKQLEDMRANNAALKEPDEVSQAVLAFLSADNPKVRYLVTPNENQAKLTITAAMRRMLEHNAEQPYEYTMEELFKMMQELDK
ncbi:MAG: hypothetical protein HKP09_05760 [Enterobacterales bacterium]|nr:hypothetical protein [Enterobacterales bacterium]